MSRVTPYLTFNGNCKEAMHFYKDCLGGELNLMVVGDTPAASQVPSQMKDHILHSVLKKSDLEIMATDMQPESLQDGNGMHLCLICQTEEELRILFDKLSAGGKIDRPLHQMFFGLIDAFTDKFGKRWIAECDQPQ
jgi:PhnB protein